VYIDGMIFSTANLCDASGGGEIDLGNLREKTGLAMP